METQRQLLFICTGNYYRSRFAEAVFNYHAQKRGMGWRAFSRGLAVHLIDGPISPFTRAALDDRGIDLSHTGPDRCALKRHDLETADRVIALKRTEHHPLMLEQFPDRAESIEYWEEHDLDVSLPEESLPRIEARVMELLDSLAENCQV